MKCPACRTDLHRLRLKDLEIDECRACRGVWFDEGEEGKLFSLRRVPARFLQGDPPGLPQVEEGQRLCPRCEVELSTVNVDGVTLDRCSGCKGFFADFGEIRELLEAQG